MGKATKLFWISPRWPLPIEDGARQATFHLVSSLASQGVRIHLLSIVPFGEKIGDLGEACRVFGVEKVSVAYREPSHHLANLLKHPHQPVTFAPYLGKKLSAEMHSSYQAWGGDGTVVFDGLHAAGWYWQLSPSERSRIPCVLRAHNVESDLWKQSADQARFPKSVLLDYQRRLVSSFEKKVCCHARLVATVSSKDGNELQAQYGQHEKLRITSTPIGIPLARLSREVRFAAHKNILFVGKLDWQPNREGLRWFLEKVWPQAALEVPELSLTVAGAGDGSWMTPYKALPKLKFLGRVPDLAPLYEEAAASIVPIFFGSGTRVKAIESSSYARPCISTEIGVEGIGLDPASSYFRAETQEDWMGVLRGFTLGEAQKRGEAAFQHVSHQFDPAKVASRFLSELNSLS